MDESAIQLKVKNDARQFVLDCLNRNPVIVLGSGASVPHGLPSMGVLAEAIITHVEGINAGSSVNSMIAWKAFIDKLKDGAGLEIALDQAALHVHPNLYAAVIDATWACVAECDQRAFVEFLSDADLPLRRLFRFLFHSQRRRVTVVTTNYDRLAEYAADMEGVCHRTGFGPGHIRTWREAERPVRFYRPDLKSEERTVDVWKVHGSIDWFQVGSSAQERVVGLPIAAGSQVTLPVTGARPMIVPPSHRKYQESFREPFRSAIAEADRCLWSAEAFLCIGYGFNDTHVQERLVKRCQNGKVRVVLVTRDVSDAAQRELLDHNTDCVIYAQGSNAGKTRIYTAQHRSGIEVEGPDLWSFEHFLDHVL